MTTHTCPPCCHNCPDLNDDVMPGCMGTAALATDPRSTFWCTCDAALPTEGTPEAQVALLTARVRELEDKLARLEAQQ
ncbi:hypothetical protein ABZ733_06835 [Streptomyces longwoodensis]|uniref:hypothetical protein n=1 Tax=Streptomyces longwoodensis TaxID=68231 RepID=UPI0033E26215